MTFHAIRPVSVLTALAACVPLAAAQEHVRAPDAPETESTAEETTDDRATAHRRLLHLAGGGVLRATSRYRDGRWEVRGRDGWDALPEGAVVRARSERDALREGERLADSFGDDPTDQQRVQLASWKIDAGLYAEGLAELDRVLEGDHDHEGALAVLPDGLLPVPQVDVAPERAADARAELYTFGAGTTATGREYAVRELREAEDRAQVIAELSEQLRSPSIRRRAFAAHALGRLKPGAELKNLFMHAVLDPSVDARRASAQALAATGDPAVLVPVLRALSSEDPGVRAQAAETVGFMAMPQGVQPLMAHLANLSAAQSATTERRVPHGYIFVGRQFAYVQDFDVEVAQFQAVADPQVNVLIEGDVLDAGVHSIGEIHFAYETKVVRDSLAKLTGERPGFTSRAWFDWWEENGDAWRNDPPATPETPGR